MAGEQETSWNRQVLQNPYFSVNNIINGKTGRLVGIEQYKGVKVNKTIKIHTKTKLSPSKRCSVSDSYSNAIRYGKLLCVAVGINSCI